MKTLVVVPCGKSKIWKKSPDTGAVEARDVYTGSPFKVNRNYVEHFESNWIILSAKFGFIKPDYLIPEDYNVTFNDKTTNPISLQELSRQAKEYLDYDCIVALGGKTYSNIVRQVFKNKKVIAPTFGLPLGKGLNKVNTSIDTDSPFHCSEK